MKADQDAVTGGGNAPQFEAHERNAITDRLQAQFATGAETLPRIVIKATIDNSQYWDSHVKLPRGYGSWAFSFGLDAPTDYLFWFTGMFSDACKAALAEARNRNAATVWTQP